jgi:hypothetical protein
MMLRHPEEVRTHLLTCHFRRRIVPDPGGLGQVSPTHHLSIGQRESLVRELVLSLAMAGRDRDALDELELCESPYFFILFFHLRLSAYNNTATFHHLRTKTIPSCTRLQDSFVYG